MDFDFPSSFYTLAIVAYTIYSWMNKNKKGENQKPYTPVEQETETVSPKPAGNDTGSQLPDWLKELLDEKSVGEQQPNQPPAANQPRPVVIQNSPEPVRTTPSHHNSRKIHPASRPDVRHRDSQESPVTNHTSLEYVGLENNSLEEINSSYMALAHEPGSKPVPSENHFADSSESMRQLNSEASGYLLNADLRRAFIWSEILKPHPEQEMRQY